MALASPHRALDQPVVDEGIRWLNYFNGRVLSAEDLRTEQGAISEARRQLGRAIGSGVVSGFEVGEAMLTSTPGAPILSVRAGLAFNDDGRAIELGRSITIGLVRVDAPTGDAAGVFRDCDIVLPGTTGRGVYLLTVGPAAADVGKAPVAGLGNEPAACNTAYSVEGVRFRLFPVPLEDGDDDEPDLLRNRIAYRMYAAADPARDASIVDPSGSLARTPTLLDELRRICYGSADVPLAVLHWKPVDGIRFVDEWSVRRRPIAPSPSGGRPSPWGRARLAEGEAMALQFRAHLRDLARTVTRPDRLRADAHFRHLPPVGVLPLHARPMRGFEYGAFFADQPTRGPAFIEGTHLAGLFAEALTYAPIDLSRGEAIWLYQVRENVQHVRTGGAPRVAECVVFSTGHLRYRADARFELAYWNHANFAEIG